MCEPRASTAASNSESWAAKAAAAASIAWKAFRWVMHSLYSEGENVFSEFRDAGYLTLGSSSSDKMPAACLNSNPNTVEPIMTGKEALAQNC